MRVVDLGAQVSYDDGMAAMRAAMARVDERPGDQPGEQPGDGGGPVLLLLEHAPVITITRRGGMSAFVSPRERIEADGIAVVETDRGGDVTFHGPGQLVGYPILRLGETSLGCNVVGYVRTLEEGIIEAARALGVKDPHSVAGRDDSGHFLTGVWCTAPVVEQAACSFHLVQEQEAKLAAIGVGLGGGVTRHGFALNVTTALERFACHIVPCGLSGRAVTSLERVLPRPPSMDTVKAAVTAALLPRLAALHRPAVSTTQARVTPPTP